MDESTWKNHFDLIRYYIGQYLEAATVREWLDRNNASLVFRIDDLHHAPNARAYRAQDGVYVIEMTAGLVRLLTAKARHVVENSCLIYREVDRADAEIVDRCHVWLLFQWIDFIFWHEFAHITCGHLNLHPRRADWSEFSFDDSSRGVGLTRHQQQRVEAQADKWATYNYLGQYGRYATHTSTSIYGKPEERRFLKDYVYAALYLFVVFEDVARPYDGNTATHPSSFIRANTVWLHGKHGYAQRTDLPSVPIADVERIWYDCYIEFYRIECRFTPADFDREMGAVETFMRTVTPMLRELGLSDS